jgi:hypothetical protein
MTSELCTEDVERRVFNLICDIIPSFVGGAEETHKNSQISSSPGLYLNSGLPH